MCVFFPKKEDERIFVYLLACMLTFDKIQKASPSMCTKFEFRGQSILKVIQFFHTVRIVLHIGCSGPVVRNLNKINMLKSMTLSLGHNTKA